MEQPIVKKVIAVHGFNVFDQGFGTVGQLKHYFEAAGYEFEQFVYKYMAFKGWIFVLGTIFNNQRAKRLASLTPEGATGVGHSNGCCILDKAARKYGAPFERLIYISPALDRNTPLAEQVGQCDVWHSPDDRPVCFSRFIPMHPWGDMGAVGSTRLDRRYRNHNKQHGYISLGFTSRRHSDIFSMLGFFGPLIVDDKHKT